MSKRNLSGVASKIKKVSFTLVAIIVLVFHLPSAELVAAESSTLWFNPSLLINFMFGNYSVFLQQSTYSDLDINSSVLFDRDSLPDERQKLLRYPQIQHRTPYGYRYTTGKYDIPYGVKTENELDTNETIKSSERISDVDLGYPVTFGLDDYLIIRKEQIQKSVWDSLVTNYDIKKALSRGDLTQMLAQSTGLTIPVPPNPVSNLFGKPEISINVNGEVNVRLGWQFDTQNLGTVSQFGQTQSTPMFSQDIRLNVSGRIGDKLSLGTDWNTRNVFEHQNEFKIGYEGQDDEIIKLVEVGNVNLPLPTTLISGGQTLFGIRSDYQFGPLYLKTLFSQRRGTRRFVDVRGGVSKQYFQLRPYDYAENHFFLDTAYKPVYDEYFSYSTPIIPKSGEQVRIKEIQVWESTADVREQAVAAGNAVAIADLEPIGMTELYSEAVKSQPIRDGFVERGNFVRLDSNRFRIDMNLGTLSIYNLRQDRTYAVAYRVEGPTTSRDDDQVYGSIQSKGFEERDTLVLKLIYRPNLAPQFTTLWDRQMRNIYNINATNINLEQTEINMWYIRQSNDSVDVLEGVPDKLVTIFGVDQVNNGTGAVPPDGQFDKVGPFFNAQRGEIIFPSTEPFGDGLVRYFSRPEIGNPDLAELYTFRDVYDTTKDVARLNTARDRFVISGEVSGRQSNRISLGAFNLAPNSVRVTLDGVELREYQDYVIDYFAGTIEIKNQRALLPQADLKIQYEQHDIFNIATKTLAGVRGDYMLYRDRRMDANLGFTVMHYNQSAVIDRVRLGEEPIANTMLGADVNFAWDTPWLTRALDLLPFYDTKAESNMNLNGEVAMVLPTPNKRRSTVASDRGKPVVYIDDFEGAEREISLGLNPGQWQYSSQPENTSLWADQQEASLFRGKLFWYQYFIPWLDIREVYPQNTSFQQGMRNLNPVIIDFDPDTRGIYNRNPEYLDRFNPEFDSTDVPFYTKIPENREKIWGGMQRLLSSFNTNFDNENIEFIEVMMNVIEWEPGATKMYIDMGQISEEIIPNGTNDTEDGITEDNPLPNNIIDAGEDVGLDAMNDAQERGEEPTVILPNGRETGGAYPFPLNLEEDPARDNYAFDFGQDDQTREREDFYFYNNFEGNAAISEVGQFPDLEVLNPNNGQEVYTDNNFFTYEVNLLPDPNVNNQIVGGNPEAGWYLFRIPVRRPSSTTGNPNFANIQYARIRFQGGTFRGLIADWKLIGSQWQRVSNFQSNVEQTDSVLAVQFVNLFENDQAPDFYTMPPGVQAPRQLNNPDPTQDIRFNEQSISISVKDLQPQEERMAVRIFRPLDLFYYKELKFFFHGDGSMPTDLSAAPKAYAFIRFGTDSSNYYEYRRPLVQGWQDLGIVFAELTAVKQIRDTSLQWERQVFPVPGDPHASFAIKGNPILTRIQFFGLGISNPSKSFQQLSTTMWVNELRLIDPENSNDWGGVGSYSVKLADLGTINASWQTSAPNFHQLEERFGNRNASTNWTVTMQGNLEKFMPESFKETKIPITYTHAEFIETPQFVANSDVILDEASQAAYRTAIDNGATEEEARASQNDILIRSQTLRVQDSWALTNIKPGIPINHWLVKNTINATTIGYSYSQDYERSPIYAEKFSWRWLLQINYALRLPELLTVQPLKWAAETPFLSAYKDLKYNFLPSNLQAGLNITRRRVTEQSRFLNFPSPVIRDFSANRSVNFSWKFAENGFLSPAIDYSFSTRSTLVPLELDEAGLQRSGGEIASRMFFNNGNLIDLGQDNQHNQTVTLNLKPMLPSIGKLNRYVNTTGTFTTTYNWQNPLQPDPAVRDIAKNASWNNNIRFNTTFSMKAAFSDWFNMASPSSGSRPGRRAPLGGPAQNTQKDTVQRPSVAWYKRIGYNLKIIFFDWEKFDITFNQTNSSVNPGVFGGSGFTNFWARGMTGRESVDLFGPSWAYQMGLIEHPHGGFNLGTSSAFPFISVSTYPGLRPPDGVMQDNFRQQTSLEFRTSRPLWEGATLDMNWKSELGFNKNQTVVTDEFGNPDFTNINATESFTRTFYRWPTIFGFNLFNNTIENVVGLYNERKDEIDALGLTEVETNQLKQEAISDAFFEGLRAWDFWGGRIGKFLPSFNWGIQWQGIEKWTIWQGLIKRMTFEHNFQSQYQENVSITDNGRNVETQTVQSGFQPLIGLNATFDDEIFKGNFTASFRWATTTSYQVNNAARSTISMQSTNELTGQANYTLQGFKFNLLGIELENELEYSFLLTYKNNRRATYDVLQPESYEGEDNEGRTLDGNTQIIVEPRIRYSLSQRVNASFFVRYEGTFTEGAAQPGFHRTQVGLDLRISISGGR